MNTTETTTGRTFDLTDEELAATLAKIEKLNKRAATKGWSGRIDLELGERRRESTEGMPGFTVRYWVTPVTITGTAPKYDGWTFLARVDWDAEVGSTVNAAPGVDIATEWPNPITGNCDHCNKIRNRKTTYLVRSDDGCHMEVGSTCLKDFLGWDFSPVWVNPDEDTVIDRLVGRAPERFDTLTILAAAWACIRAYGFRPSSFDEPTKYQVMDLLSTNKKDNERVKEAAPYFKDSYEMAEQVRAFILSDRFSGTSDYVSNLKDIARADSVTYKHLGYLVSAPQAMARADERDLTRKTEKAQANNTFAGPVGTKVEGLKVRITGIRYISGSYGTTVLYTMVGTDDHRTYKWFASREVLGDRKDTCWTLAGTIKDHDTWNERNSTVLTRCKAQAI